MRASRFVLAAATLAASFATHATSLGDLTIYDRTDGKTLPIHQHRGRLYVAGEPKHQYELRIANRSGGRVLAVTSVDGVNVISGQTAAQGQSGYVLDAWDTVSVEGWRKSLDEVATFYFTSLPDSYAARTGRPNDVGVIGVALFREREACCYPSKQERPMTDADSAPSTAGAGARASSPREEESAKRSDPRLGTGHGPREGSPAQYVNFQRASSRPDETIVIYYDSRRNLIAQGVLPAPSPHLADRRPNPFPSGFVPDP